MIGLLFVYQLITETIEKVESKKQKEIALQFKKHYKRTENMKPEALEEIRKKLKIPFKLKYELLEGMSKDKKLNDFILNQEEEDAKDIAEKLSN